MMGFLLLPYPPFRRRDNSYYGVPGGWILERWTWNL